MLSEENDVQVQHILPLARGKREKYFNDFSHVRCNTWDKFLNSQILNVDNIEESNNMEISEVDNYLNFKVVHCTYFKGITFEQAIKVLWDNMQNQKHLTSNPKMFFTSVRWVHYTIKKQKSLIISY